MPTETEMPLAGIPDSGADRVARAVRAFSGANRRRLPGADLALGIADHADESGGAAIELAEPMPIYTVDPHDTARDRLADAEQTGWRYLVLGVDGVHVADLPQDRSGPPDLINSSDLALRIVAAAKMAGSRVDERHGYQARILDLNLLGNSVLWLKSDSGKTPDRFFTLERKSKEIAADVLLRRIDKAVEEKRRGLATGHDEAGG